MLSNVSTIVRFAFIWAGYILCERVVEVVRYGPLSEPGASLDAPEAPDEPKATEPCADGSRYLFSFYSGLLGGLCGLLPRQRRQPGGGATRATLASQLCTRLTQNGSERSFLPICVHSCVSTSVYNSATVYTSAPNRRREATSANLCTLLRPHGLARDPGESQQCTQMTQNSSERPFLPICVHSCVPQASRVTGRGHGSHDVDGPMAPVMHSSY